MNAKRATHDDTVLDDPKQGLDWSLTPGKPRAVLLRRAILGDRGTGGLSGTNFNRTKHEVP